MNVSCPAARRIGAMILRYLFLHKRSLPRTLEIFFWPVMDLLVWGFVTVYIQRWAQASLLGQIIVFLIGGMILWDILFRSQQSVSLSFMEEMWSRNVINLLISPLRIWEWITATFLYGLIKVALIGCVLALLAWLLYAFKLWTIGLPLVGFITLLVLFGWGLGMATAGILLRWGHAAEALIWGVPFLIQPISAVFYPLQTLPQWLRPIAVCLPSTHIFEGMRAAIAGQPVDPMIYVLALGLDVVFAVIGAFFFTWTFAMSKRSGRLGRLGMD